MSDRRRHATAKVSAHVVGVVGGRAPAPARSARRPASACRTWPGTRARPLVAPSLVRPPPSPCPPPAGSVGGTRWSPGIAPGLHTEGSTTRARAASTSGHGLVEVGVERLEELLGGQPRGVATDEERQVLGHLAALDRLDAYVLERLGELAHRRRAVELGPE